MRSNSAAEQLPGNLCLSSFPGRERLQAIDTTGVRKTASELAHFVRIVFDKR
jgi:hypothetical protein